MSDWEDFCESVGIDAHDPEQFFDLLDSWSREDVGAQQHRLHEQRRPEGVPNPHCSRCGGTGHIGRYRHVEGGRCFKCLPG